jgi:hypothetical protein
MRVHSVLFAAVVATACQAQQPAADTVALPRAEPIVPSQPSQRSAARTDVGDACTRVATRMRSSGARVLVTDTVIDSSAYQPRQTACLVLADSFAVAPRADLLHSTPIGSGWSWHPFDGTGAEDTYGIAHDTVHCEVSPAIHVTKQRSVPDSLQFADRFHVLCYPDP